jgi:hypothetical protein
MSKERKKFEKRKERERKSRHKVLLRREQVREDTKKRKEILENPFGESTLTVNSGAATTSGRAIGGPITIYGGPAETIAKTGDEGCAGGVITITSGS